jgi:hypothetical protein
MLSVYHSPKIKGGRVSHDKKKPTAQIGKKTPSRRRYLYLFFFEDPMQSMQRNERSVGNPSVRFILVRIGVFARYIAHFYPRSSLLNPRPQYKLT